MSARRRVQDDADDPRVIAHKARARRAIEVIPTDVIVGVSLHDAQGYAFTMKPTPARLIPADSAAQPGGLGRYGQGATIHVLQAALDHGRLGPGVAREVGQARKRGARIEVVR